MNFKSLPILLLLLAPIPSLANGVERGAVKEAIQKSSADIQDDLLEMISDAIVSSCSLDASTIVSAKVRGEIDQIDQGVRDYYYNILITVSLDKGKSQETISVVAAKYGVSNPSIPNKEVLSITSNLCKR